MVDTLRLRIGQHSDKGRKDTNQDFHGIYQPKEPQLSSKGIAVAIADGISSSSVSHIASESAVTSFLEDYYCTSEAWSVKKSAMSSPAGVGTSFPLSAPVFSSTISREISSFLRLQLSHRLH